MHQVQKMSEDMNAMQELVTKRGNNKLLGVKDSVEQHEATVVKAVLSALDSVQDPTKSVQDVVSAVQTDVAVLRSAGAQKELSQAIAGVRAKGRTDDQGTEELKKQLQAAKRAAVHEIQELQEGFASKQAKHEEQLHAARTHTNEVIEALDEEHAMMERELAARVIGAVIIRNLLTENNLRLKEVGLMKWRETALMSQIRRRAKGQDDAPGNNSMNYDDDF